MNRKKTKGHLTVMNYLKLTIISFFLSFSLSLSPGFAANIGKQHVISGQAMGTFYTIKFISTRKESLSSWKNKVDNRLKQVDDKFSMFNPKSELCLFNREKPGIPISLSPEFYSILLTAQKLYRLTSGSWDGTVKPLVDLWGFGTEKRPPGMPGPDQIARALSETGFNLIDIQKPYTALKIKTVTLDLGSLAKGYGVDAVAALFYESGIQNVLVEIGGEIYASGKNQKGKDWSVGISRPDKQFINQDIYKIIRLHDQAIATSGNYRNFFETGGKIFSHIIDPRTGYPVDNIIVSASVISRDCILADGLATALMIMDIQKGLRLVNRLEQTECMIIQKIGQELIQHTSEKFNEFIVK